MFVGVGAITGSLKAMKAAKLANAIQKVAEISDGLDVTSKIMSKVGVGFKKIGNNAGKFVIRNATGTILGTAFDVVDGVYKKVKKKTSNEYNVFLGTIEAQVQFVGENTKKVRTKIWGKCSSGAGARVDATSAYCVDDVVMEVVDFIKRKKHEGEGVFGQYNELSAKNSGKKFFDDNGVEVFLTAHHIPNDSYMKSLNLPGYSRNKGLCITLESRNGKKYDVDRHSWTETFKSSVDYSHLTPTQVLQRQVNEVIAISLKDGFSDIEIRNIKKELQKLVDKNHELYPNAFNKFTVN